VVVEGMTSNETPNLMKGKKAFVSTGLAGMDTASMVMLAASNTREQRETVEGVKEKLL
jgi:hypothetical protein